MSTLLPRLTGRKARNKQAPPTAFEDRKERAAGKKGASSSKGVAAADGGDAKAAPFSRRQNKKAKILAATGGTSLTGKGKGKQALAKGKGKKRAREDGSDAEDDEGEDEGLTAARR
jgi:hypothetical protein